MESSLELTLLSILPTYFVFFFGVAQCTSTLAITSFDTTYVVFFQIQYETAHQNPS